jgi:tetratricopeptide (TPR) repeat protein
MGEIEDLYLSGIASAKAGNQRLAQAFFKRVIRINPRHAGAWLWLSEVLDDPDDIAYCLEAVLAIDPNNEKARLGLELVRERGADTRQPRRPREWSAVAELREMDLPTILAQTPTPAMPVVLETPKQPWRDTTQALVRASIFTGAVLVVLILAVVMTMLPAAPSAPADDAAIPTIDVTSLRQQEREGIQAYFRDLDALLGPLRLAHDVYRGNAVGPGSLSEGVDNTRRLLDQVAAAQEGLAKLVPPPALVEAHREYLQGLGLEQNALEDFMNYYATSQNGYFNRGIVKFQEAEQHLKRAQGIWAAYRNWAGLAEPTRLPTPSPISTPTYGLPPTATPTFRPYPTFTPTPFPTQPIGDW